MSPVNVGLTLLGDKHPSGVFHLLVWQGTWACLFEWAGVPLKKPQTGILKKRCATHMQEIMDLSGTDLADSQKIHKTPFCVFKGTLDE